MTCIPKTNRRHGLLDTVLYKNNEGHFVITYVVSLMLHKPAECYLLAGLGARIMGDEVFSPDEAAKLIDGKK